MREVRIKESGMDFGPFPEQQVWPVERSPLYKSIEEGVRIAEFVLLRPDSASPPRAWIVEAKSSSPRPETQPDFNGFIEEIRAKLSNAFTLTVATRLGRFDDNLAKLPAALQVVDPSALQFVFVLVIKNHPNDWLIPIQAALAKAMKGLIKSWNLPPTSVAVLNAEGAKRRGLILPENKR